MDGVCWGQMRPARPVFGARGRVWGGPRPLLACHGMHTQVGVGSVNNTFGIKGVEEQCYFLKSIEDAHRLRVRIA